MDILDVEVLQPKCRCGGGRIPESNIVNVKLAVGRRFGSVINPSGGGGHLEMMIDQLL